MARFRKGQVPNPKGCPKGAHHIGRPRDEIKAACYQLATEAAPLILARLIRTAQGEATEQVITEAGECVPVPAPTPSQIKASEVVLNYAIEKLSERLELSGADGGPLNGIPTDAVLAVAQALRQRALGSSGNGTGKAS